VTSALNELKTLVDRQPPNRREKFVRRWSSHAGSLARTAVRGLKTVPALRGPGYECLNSLDKMEQVREVPDPSTCTKNENSNVR
jgi:hypothetical protein